MTDEQLQLLAEEKYPYNVDNEYSNAIHGNTL